MANFNLAFTFVMGLEDSSGTGQITQDADGLTRWGLLDKYQPDLVQAGFYTNKVSGPQALAMAKPIYQAQYWDPILGDEITDDEVAAQIFSIAVNDGVTESTKLAQGVAEVRQDGVFGNDTLSAVNAMDPDEFIEEFNAAAQDYYEEIAEDDPAKEVDLQGWINRLNAIDNFQA
jgi:lysozyme family protein